MIAEAGRLFGASLDVEETVRSVGSLVVGWFADWCIVDLIGPDGRFERANVAAADERDAETARTLLRFPLDPERRSLVFEAMRSRTPVLVSPVTHEHLAEVAQNSEHLAILSRLHAASYIAVPLVAHDQLVGALLIVRKVGLLTQTELRVAEEIASLAAIAIHNARRFRNATNALGARDNRLAIVAHDLRSPISTMTFAAGLLQLRLREAGFTGLERLIDGILRNAEYMTRLVEDLTDVANLESGRYSMRIEPVPALSIVEDVLAAFAARATGLGIRLTAEVAEPLSAVLGDRARILQVFANLVGNALKFTRAGGSVRLTVQPMEGHVHFAVIDSGRGIAAEVASRIFEPFFRHGEDPDRGLGLGLSIAKNIVELHDGHIWVASEPGIGTEMHITLPAAAATATP